MDLIIQQTDYDALASKLASIQKKYLPPGPLTTITATLDDENDDNNNNNKQLNDQLSQFYKDIAQLYSDYYHSLKLQSRRVFGKINKAIDNSAFPVMNYGTYLRTLAIDISILTHITKLSRTPHKQFQIVNFGAGSDLRMVQYLSQFSNTDPSSDKSDILPHLVRFVDIDFKPAIDLKGNVLSKANKTLLSTYLTDPRYVLLACDLNDAAVTIASLLETAHLDPKIPTIFISECVLCYMTERDSQNLIDAIVKDYTNSSNGTTSIEATDSGAYLWVSYDPIGGEGADSKFGKIMRANLLESRNLDMPTLLVFNSKQKYARRWSGDAGTNVKTDIVDMWEFLNSVISDVEQRRLQRLQFLDEVEELKIMQSHYVLLNARWN